MNSNARVLSIVVAMCSTLAIVAIAQPDPPLAKQEIDKLLVFEITFNQRMNEVIRRWGKEAGPTSFVTYKCQTNVALERIYMKPPPPPPVASAERSPRVAEPTPADQCKLTRMEEHQNLRDAVIRRLDDVYLGKVSRQDFEALLKGQGGDFFSGRIPMVPMAPSK